MIYFLFIFIVKTFVGDYCKNVDGKKRERVMSK
jgi:hypothetical protein